MGSTLNNRLNTVQHHSRLMPYAHGPISATFFCALEPGLRDDEPHTKTGLRSRVSQPLQQTILLAPLIVMSQQENPSSTLRSPLDLHQITITAEGPVGPAHTRSWKVFVRNQRTGQESARFTLEDPFNEHEYQEVRWYVEDFAMRDPFSQARANKATESQLRYGKRLVSAIRPFIDEVLGIKPENTSAHSWGAVHLLVAGNGTGSSLHSLLWEIIERVECCNPPTFFAVTRVAERDPNDEQSILPGKEPSSSEQHFRILYVSARPSLRNDISYRAISRHIWELLKRTDGQHSQILLDFVRPGTWTKFQSVLKDRGKGYYDLVHFDMHGTINKHSSPHKFA